MSSSGIFMSSVQNVVSRITVLSSPSIHYLVIFGLLVLAIFLIRLIIRRHRLRMARGNIPFVIGGWGTRGKSGTERKKAALFEALGFNVLSKTTGCEAMIIHASPGLDAVELPIYRPGDKASIWEQDKIVQWADRFHTEVLLWECMALSTDYASLLQHDWMNDDLSTISNTFVDHENVQGPSGYNVTESLSSFIPAQSVLFTAEESMLPVLRDRAHRMKTEVQSVPWHESELIAQDVLSLYPYRVHPRNLGLILQLTRHLGIDDQFTLKEIADHIIPDLGAFQCYKVEFRSRFLEFWNGMSANDRTSTLSNWNIAGFNQREHDPCSWTVTVVNNRDDRILRSREFAEILVHDTPAHLHVLIGTNLNGMQGYLQEAIRDYVADTSLIGDNISTGCDDKLVGRLQQNLIRSLHRFRIEGITQPDIENKLRLMSGTSKWKIALSVIVETLMARNLQDPLEVLALLRKEIDQDVPYIEAIAQQLYQDCRDHRRIVDFETFLTDSLRSGNGDKNVYARINARYNQLIVELFMDRIYIIRDPYFSGNQIIDAITKRLPPHFHIKMMGLQNIKGTGLDFAYRWLSLSKVQNAIGNLNHERKEERFRAALWLSAHNDYGIIDAPLALNALKTASEDIQNSEPEMANVIRDAIEKVSRTYQQQIYALESGKKGRLAASVLRFCEQILELGDSKRRLRKAKQVMDDLFNARISHPRAAQLLWDISKRQYGGWLRRK